MRNQIGVRVSEPAMLKRLELADKLGINVSEVVREALPELLDRKIKEKATEIRSLLKTVPA